VAAYRRVYDSHHLQADCKELGSAPNPTFGNRVWTTFFTTVTGVIVTAWQGGLIEEIHGIVIMFAAWRSIAAFVA